MLTLIGSITIFLMQTPEVQTYRIQTSGKSYEVRIHRSIKNNSTSISNGKGVRQELIIPQPWSAEISTDKLDLPSAFLLKSKTLILAVVCTRPSGTWGFRSPVLFRLSEGRWKRLSYDPDKTSFSNRGSFYIDKDRLIVWDIFYDSNTSHWAPQRYRICTFTIQSNRLKMIQRRLTKNRYAGGNSVGQPNNPRSGDDPLVEFGLHWKWWGSSK